MPCHASPETIFNAPLSRRVSGGAQPLGFIASCLVAAAACWSLVAPAAAHAATLRIDKLYEEMRGYCMAQVCAGMSINELSAQKGGRLVLDRPLVDDKLCNSRQQQSINGTWTGPDGTRFDVAFYMIPGSGVAGDIYRVVQVSLQLRGVTADELDILVKTLVTRYKLSRRGEIWIGPKHDLLEVSVTRETVQEPLESVSRLRLIVAPTGPFAYVANQPWCQGDAIPPLPDPKPPLPVL